MINIRSIWLFLQWITGIFKPIYYLVIYVYMH